MGRSNPSYTRVFEEEMRRIMMLKNVLNSDYDKYIDHILNYLRSKRGLLSKHPNPDMQIDLIYLLIIELMRRIDECERLDSEGFSR